MVLLTSLPFDVWHIILNMLTIFDIEAIAKTFNRDLYAVAMSVLDPRDVAWMNNARRMCAIFPHGDCTVPAFPGSLPAYPSAMGSFWNEIPQHKYRELDLHGRKGPYRRTSPPDLRWAQLNGSFKWAKSLAPDIEAKLQQQRGAHQGRHASAPRSALDEIEAQAQELDLRLPRGFRQFFRSPRVHLRFASVAAGWHFTLDDVLDEYTKQLPRITRGIADGHEGFLIRFYRDLHSDRACYLWLMAGGGECVLYSLFDLTCDHPSPLGRWAVCIQGLSFEEYLFQLYFEEQLACETVYPRPQALKDYVQHVYQPWRIPKADKRVKMAEWKANRNRMALVPEDL